MKIFVTGGTGFIGSHFLKTALAAGHEVIAIRRSGSQPKFPIEGQIQWVDADLSTVDFRTLGDLNHACLVHFAAAGVNPEHASWDTCFAVNVNHSLRCWIDAISAGVGRIIICGSCFEYGLSGHKYEWIPTIAPLEPTGPYHASKCAASLAAHALAIDRKIEVAILRPFHVYGLGEDDYRFWPSLRRAALAGEDFPMTSGEQVRDFIEVSSVAEIFLHAATSKHLRPGEPVIQNVGTGTPLTLRAFAEAQWKAAGATGTILPGVIPMRANEVMRYVPAIENFSKNNF